MTETDEFALNDLDAPIPDGLDTPFLYWLFVMPIAPRAQTKGGIILPDQVRDGEAFMNSLGRIAAMGEGCFQSEKMRMDLKQEHFPKVGDLVRYAGVRNRQWLFKGVTFIDVRDDMIRSFVKEENVRDQHYRFHR